MEDTLLDRAMVAQYLAITVETFNKMRRGSGFAEPIVIGKRLRWRACDIQAWIDVQLAGGAGK